MTSYLPVLQWQDVAYYFIVAVPFILVIGAMVEDYWGSKRRSANTNIVDDSAVSCDIPFMMDIDCAPYMEHPGSACATNSFGELES